MDDVTIRETAVDLLSVEIFADVIDHQRSG